MFFVFHIILYKLQRLFYVKSQKISRKTLTSSSGMPWSKSMRSHFFPILKLVVSFTEALYLYLILCIAYVLAFIRLSVICLLVVLVCLVIFCVLLVFKTLLVHQFFRQQLSHQTLGKNFFQNAYFIKWKVFSITYFQYKILKNPTIFLTF